MNPPFSRSADGYEDSFTALCHLHAAHKCLAPGGRLVAILPNWIDRPGRNAVSLARMIDGASIVERFALAEGCFAKHSTSIATILLVIDKVPGLPLVHTQNVATLSELTAQPGALRRAARTSSENYSTPSPALFAGFTRKTVSVSPKPARRARDMAIAPISYTALDEPAALGEQIGDYLPYRPARLIFDDAGEHPTALVESLAMGSVAPPKPNYRPLLPLRIVKERILSAAQLETLVYAGQAHSEWLGTPTKDSGEDESTTRAARKGCCTEIIAWKTRLFLPDATAEAILTAICAANQNAVPAQA